MAEHPLPLDSTQLINNEIPLLSTPVANGDGAQQVILVQVNPGEAFTIRREDGQFQCITGPAQVPMMSPNGSVPPIYVPPGYAPQVIEDNGVRRVVVVPQPPEFHPSNQTVMHRPPPPLPGFIPLPTMMPPPPRHVYSSVTGAGDMANQYTSQYHTSQVYGDLDSATTHGRSSFRDERSSKTYERLQKKLKDRHAVPKEKLSSPPSSPQKCHSPTNEHNGLVKGQNLITTGTAMNMLKGDSCSPVDAEMQEKDEETKELETFLSNLTKPILSDIQARTAVLTWSPPSDINDDSNRNSTQEIYTYDVLISSTGKDGKYKIVHTGEKNTVTLDDLRPATDYHARIQAESNCTKGNPSESVSFTTMSCEPDTPNHPRIINRTKNSLSLQWKASCDNGSKIHSYLLEWDEGKGNGEFCQCYYGQQKQFRITKLSPAMGYTFRLAAKNDMGMSGFSEEVMYYTSGSAPSMPASPTLIKAEVTSLSLQWSKPSGTPSDEGISYVLEMEDEISGYGFKPKYDGDDLMYMVKNLKRNTNYKFRVIAYNSEGKSSPSEVVEFATCPDKPGAPSKPFVKGRIHAQNFKISWDPPKDDGGATVTTFIMEMSEGTSGNKWDMVYSGAAREHLCDRLSPGCSYRLRVYCISEGGKSAVSEAIMVQTPAVVPGPCLPPRPQGKPKAKEMQLRWGPPQLDGGSPVTFYSLEICPVGSDEHKEVYQGSEVECTVNNLLPGTTYSFRLRAANKAGYGSYSEKCEILTAPGPPDQCKPPQVTCRSATCALVHWKEPANYGAEITDYRLEWGGVQGCMQICYCGPGFSHEIKGLSPATVYYCRVQAVNVVGSGNFSEVVTCFTPASVPAAVTCLWGVKEEGIENPYYSPSTCLAIKWEKPCDHGSEITGYSIEYGEKQFISVGKISDYIIENLQPDTTYRIRIQALNSLGAGPFSHTVKLMTKPFPPDPPRLECAVYSHQSLKLKWGEGTVRTSTSDSIQYHLQMEDKNGRFVSLYKGPCHTFKVQRLNESISYKFRIQACNEAGEGSFSEDYIFTTTKSVPAALKAPRIDRVNDHSCDIIWENLQSVKGDPIIYCLQLLVGKESEFRQIYRGPNCSFRYSGLQLNCEYRFRVCAIRKCQDTGGVQELIGPYSATVLFISQRTEAPASIDKDTVEIARTHRTLSDEQCAAVILVLFAIFSIMIAFIIQYFVIK
uniref:Fibronectin type-III domain-containing protein 3A n=2 Tax=Geotrypetes seraphini TaxID=260995 RepID=A0A6P8R6R0_GEOSA|nr:fibronectin type-III domain-containing protein 3A isoform X1 [Geotrypetes seraphini]XP_033803704.1 fibronectin type-III domain-containing protein 3A isoform X1 [Geotrypetes seraphini]XP_033803705.1 fibronectin type-III domain-containing protein 3A isoform X1 [Geotrypetes seraphini]